MDQARRGSRAALAFAALLMLVVWAAPARPAPTDGDTLAFGDPASEKAHALKPDHSDTVRGGLGLPARRLLPPASPGWEGGRIAFTLRVDPERPNYLTARFWGDDVSEDRLILFCAGKQIGYRHLGDVDLLDHGSDAPVYNGRFYYTTTPLPLDLTRGKTQVDFEIRASGPIWGYGTSFEQYQKPMKEPTRGIYAVYTHTDGYFVPPPSEKQGDAPPTPPVRKQPGPEVLDQVKARVSGEINGALRATRPLNQMQMHLLARAYHVKWSPAYQNGKAVEQVTRSMDALYAAWKQDPKLLETDRSTWNPGWFGFGPAGDAVRLLAGPLGASLDQEIEDGAGGKVKRRAAWAELLKESRDWLRRHRRLYTNQSMIVDMNLYRSNRGLAAVDPARAMPEKETRRYLYEAIGLQPWLGSDTESGPDRRAGENYYQLTGKGLTRELGFVGYYGEVLDWVAQIYDATRDPGQPGDEKIRAQLARMERARAVFRYPMLDAEGNRAMRAETVVGWRDVHFPGDVTYGERPTRDASALYSVAATLDRESIGYAQQMFADNQFFASVRDQMKEGGLRVTSGLLGVPDQYELLKAQPASPRRLPMSPGQPDSVFADEEDGVVAVRHGNELLYASLYWRARHGINNLARVHFLQPRLSRNAVVREETEFEPSGLTYTRPDWVNMGFANGGFRYPGDLHSAHTGEKLPIAKIPAGIEFKPGQESPYAGKGSYYTLRYGPYLIGMNCTQDRIYDLTAPDGVKQAPELVSGKTLALNGPVKVGPLSTVVLYLPGQ